MLLIPSVVSLMAYLAHECLGGGDMAINFLFCETERDGLEVTVRTSIREMLNVGRDTE
jgi:hypothetical protein